MAANGELYKETSVWGSNISIVMKLHINTEVTPPYEVIRFLKVEKLPKEFRFSEGNSRYRTPGLSGKVIYRVEIAVTINEQGDIDVPDICYMVIPNDYSEGNDIKFLENRIKEKFDETCWDVLVFFRWLIAETEKALTYCTKLK